MDGQAVVPSFPGPATISTGVHAPKEGPGEDRTTFGFYYYGTNELIWQGTMHHIPLVTRAPFENGDTFLSPNQELLGS
jgi:hypothetical protein